MTTSRLPEKMIRALYRKDYRILDKLLKQETVNLVDENGETLLHLAVAAEDADPKMIKFLIDHGAVVDVPTGAEQWTPLHFAARVVRKDIVQVLLDAGADANAPDSSGNTPLGHVVMAPDPRVFLVHLLVRHGADPNRKPKGGESPREVGMRTGQQDLFDGLEVPTGLLTKRKGKEKREKRGRD